MSDASRIVHKTCNLCEAMCGLRIETDGRRLGRIEADPEDPFSRGAICPKAIALGQIQDDPDRLRRPLRRRGEGWEEIDWDEALAEAAERIAAIQLREGDDAVATYLGNPGAHNLGILLGLTPFGAALSTRNRYSASSLDQNPKHASSLLLFGHWLQIPVPDVDRTDFL
ncbi:MAG: molybdopterin-dependent oxidoreductase, partial [Myxococcota bacterium]